MHGGEGSSPVHEGEEENGGGQHSSAYAQAYLGLHGEGRQRGLSLILDRAQGQPQVAHLHLGGGRGS